MVLWFNEIDKNDVGIVGGKSANLGEMASTGKIPVPNGFSTTSKAYNDFINYNNLKDKIQGIIESTNVDDTKSLNGASKAIKDLFLKAKFQKEFENQVRKCYSKLIQSEGNVFVAVRSSATSEDLPDASFAGEQETYLNVKGDDEVLEKIKECYASLFTPRAIYYRQKKNFSHFQIALSATVQRQVFSEESGVMFTLDVSNGDTSKIVIESSYGLGEYVVGGTVTPDTFYVDKATMKIEKRMISNKNKMLKCLETGGTEELVVSSDKAMEPSLNDREILELASYGKEIEAHYSHAMDIEWAKDSIDHKIYIVQARPETVWSNKKQVIIKWRLMRKMLRMMLY